MNLDPKKNKAFTPLDFFKESQPEKHAQSADHMFNLFSAAHAAAKAKLK